MKQDVIIFDIDGTLANSESRAKLFLNGKTLFDIDWDSFYDRCDLDDPIEPTCYICKLLAQSYKIIYLTGRPERVREKTKAWLDKQWLPSSELFMRKDPDHRQDYILKKEIFEKEIAPKYNVIAVFEDRQQCVAMWRELGITCYQVDKGDF